MKPFFCLFVHFSLEPDTSKLAGYIDSIAKGMVYNKEYTEFERFFKDKPQIFNKIARNVEQSLETIRNNNRWQEQNYEKIGRLLSQF